MTAPVPYVLFPGTARSALEFYAETFGGELHLNTFSEFSRTDGPGDAIAHGMLSGGPVALFGADASADESPVHIEGMLLSLLGTAAPEVLHRWFDALAEGGVDIDPLTTRPWGASDGQVTDRYGLRWLIGYEPKE